MADRTCHHCKSADLRPSAWTGDGRAKVWTCRGCGSEWLSEDLGIDTRRPRVSKIEPPLEGDACRVEVQEFVRLGYMGMGCDQPDYNLATACAKTKERHGYRPVESLTVTGAIGGES